MSDQTPDQPARPPWAPVSAPEDRTDEPTADSTAADDNPPQAPPAPPRQQQPATPQQAPHPYAPGPGPAPPTPPPRSTPTAEYGSTPQSSPQPPAPPPSPYLQAPDPEPTSQPTPTQNASPPRLSESPLPWERSPETGDAAPPLSPYAQPETQTPRIPDRPESTVPPWEQATPASATPEPERVVPPWEQATPASATPEPERVVPPWEQPTPASATPEPPPWRDEPAPSAPPTRPRFRAPEPSSPPSAPHPQPGLPDSDRAAEPAHREAPAPWEVPYLSESTPQNTPPEATAPPAGPPPETTPTNPSQPAWAALDEQLNPPQARAQASPSPFTPAPEPVRPRPGSGGLSAQIPEPIDIDTDDDINLRQPTSPPPPEETFPATGRTRGSLFPGTVSPYDHTQDAGPTGSGYESPHDESGGFQSLGQSAVTNASLSAGGAHTPMGGVPLASSRMDRDPVRDEPGPQFGNDEPAFTPRFAPADPAPTGEQPTVRFAPVSGEHQVGGPAVGEHPHQQAAPVRHEQPPTMAYPLTGGAAPNTTNGDAGDNHDTHDAAHAPWWRSTVALVIYGLLVMGGLAYGAYYFLLAPEPIALEAPVLLEGPPANGVTPIKIENPTPFLEVIPTGTLTHSLIEIETFEPGELGHLSARTVEAHDLTYSDAEDTYIVRAIQHYNTDDAIANYEALAGDASDVAPVEADGSTVGERAILDTDDGAIIVWRNETAVLTLRGPESGSVDFFTFYDL